MSSDECTQDCIARRPLGSESHISSCPNFGSELSGEVHFLPRRNPGETFVTRTPEGQVVGVPDEIISEAERDWRAYKLFRDGHTWQEIASKENYESAGAAAASVKRHLGQARLALAELVRADIIADHVSRLQFARKGLVAGVKEGKPQSVMAFLAIEDRWVKAFGLDVPDAEDQGVQTVVVPSDEYLEKLRQAAQPSQPEADAG